MRHKGREVVYVQRGDSSAKWLFWGAVLGAGLALMYAPRSGEAGQAVLPAWADGEGGSHQGTAHRAPDGLAAPSE